MNISILLPDLRGGGVERIRLVLAKEFARQGHEVEFVLKQARGVLLEEAQEARGLPRHPARAPSAPGSVDTTSVYAP